MNETNEKKLFVFPLVFYFIALLINQLFIAYKFELGFTWPHFLAQINALANDAVWPFFMLFFIGLLPIRAKLKTVLLNLLILPFCLMAFLDIAHFKVTLSRFNWNIWHDLNWYSFKASFQSTFYNFVLAIFVIIILLFLVSIGYIRKQGNRITNFSFRPGLTGIIICLVLKNLFPIELLPEISGFTPVYMSTNGKNSCILIISDGFTKGFVNSNRVNPIFSENDASFTSDEMAKLRTMALFPPDEFHEDYASNPPYNRIILIVFESLALEYLHNFNRNVPAAATSFFDKLSANYPMLNNFYTSESPTIKGFNALFLSRIPFNPQLSLASNEKSLVRVFKERFSGKAIFLRGVSKFYGNERLIITDLFGFDQLISYEELAEEYPKPSLKDWGFHDNVVFDKAIKLLRKEVGKPFFLTIKTIDQHQPPHYCGIPVEKLPDEIAKHENPIIKTLYWANNQLEEFIRKCEDENLFDDKTLVIITSDHYPFAGFGHAELVTEVEYSQLGRIPLIFYTHNTKPFIKLDSQIKSCQLDIAPTLCYLFGVKQPERYLGQNLLANPIPRKIGFFNDELFYEGPNESFRINFTRPEFPSILIKKWATDLFTKPKK
ncbi:MAG: hypothetical protein Kow0029_16580 [Candidatus Rifleibacteriota bacterium]